MVYCRVSHCCGVVSCGVIWWTCLVKVLSQQVQRTLNPVLLCPVCALRAAGAFEKGVRHPEHVLAGHTPADPPLDHLAILAQPAHVRAAGPLRQRVPGRCAAVCIPHC